MPGWVDLDIIEAGALLRDLKHHVQGNNGEPKEWRGAEGETRSPRNRDHSCGGKIGLISQWLGGIIFWTVDFVYLSVF